VTTPGPWPALLSELDALRGRYLAALAGPAERGQGGDVAEAVCSTLEVLSDVARTATTRLEARALMRAALDHLLHGELEARVCSCPPSEHRRKARVSAHREVPPTDKPRGA
jgi:hypothetical protein